MGLWNTEEAIPESEIEESYTGLKNAIHAFIKLKPEDDLLLREIFTPVVLKKGSHFVEQGRVCSEIGFVNKGVFRFYQVKDGVEITSDFSFEKSFITSYISLITEEPSGIAVQALEDSFLLVLKRSRLYELYETHHSFERMGRLLAEKAFTDNTRHLLSLLNDKAETRYMNLLEQAPHLVRKIPLVYIASYLGITPETLSRIRRKISRTGIS